LIATLGARKNSILLVFDPLPANVIFAETNLASKTGILSQPVTALALQVLLLQDLT